MKILLIGSGGREHALAWALAKSPQLTELFIAPGNAGMMNLGTLVSLAADNVAGLVSFATDQAIDLVVVGPEVPLVLGLSDQLTAQGIKVFGPSQNAAQLEGSKAFTKALCRKYNIPTAAYEQFSDPEEAKLYVRSQPAPIVIKADGLAAGKGVVIAETTAQAVAAIEEMFDGRFGDAGQTVVVEAFMTGEEASFFVLADGQSILPLATAQDHKRVGDGDTGPNTGGMGAYSPAPVMTDALVQQTIETIIKPTVAGMAAEGMPYQGVLYAGLMLTPEGPKLVEYNCRFGDPECQVLMPRLTSDVLDLLLACAEGRLDTVSATWTDQTALTVVMAAQGYPGSYHKGTLIKGVEAAEALSDVHVFHAGTRDGPEGLEAAGGRVLNVTALGESVAQAQAQAYAGVDAIDWPDGFARRDIGWRAIK